MKLEGCAAVVVGGASGMGRASAELLAARGARVAVLDRSSSDGAEVAKSFGASFHPCDITDVPGTESALAAAAHDLGAIHIAVNTAGGGTVGRVLSKAGPHDIDAFRRVLELNVVGTFNLNRWQAHHMSANEPDEEGERGVIVNTSSIAAFEGQIGQVAYSAAKAAIAGMMLPMARDLGSLGIRAVAIAPSLFETGAVAGVPTEMRAKLTETAAFPRRMGHPEEYARLAVAIAENPMLNGSTIRLDAGQRFGPK